MELTRGLENDVNINLEVNYCNKPWNKAKGSLFQFVKFGCQKILSSQKLATIKEGISDWPDNDGKKRSIYKFFWKTLGFSWAFLFSFDVIWEVWLPRVIISLKVGYCKRKNVGLTRQRWDITSHSTFKFSFSERQRDLVRSFSFQFGQIWNVWLPGVVN